MNWATNRARSHCPSITVTFSAIYSALAGTVLACLLNNNHKLIDKWLFWCDMAKFVRVLLNISHIYRWKYSILRISGYEKNSRPEQSDWDPSSEAHRVPVIQSGESWEGECSPLYTLGLWRHPETGKTRLGSIESKLSNQERVEKANVVLSTFWDYDVNR